MKSLFFLFILLTGSPIFVVAQETAPLATWFLPTALSDQNTKVTFEVDSTWHLVKGETTGLRGNAKLQDQTDPNSIVVQLKVPVVNFDTDNGMRDERMREVMAEESYKYVSFESEGKKGECTPALVLRDGTCEDVLSGKLTIRSKTSPVEIPIVISSSGENGFVVKGKLPISWAEYGVEDPSILIARLDPIVTVLFEVTLTTAAA